MNAIPFNPAIFFFIILVLILIIFIIREVLCWYWKINDQVSIQNDILKALKEILEEIKDLKGNAMNSTETTNERETLLNTEPKETIEKMKFINF